MNVEPIEHQIEVTRQELDQTLDELQARLSPGRRIKAALHAAQEGGSHALHRGVSWTISHPVAGLAVAAVFAIAFGPDLRRRR
jgi:Protein of unknown function (DUF3618)